MKKIFLLLSIVALLMLVVAPAALACKKGTCAGPGMVMCTCFDKKLALSDDQQKKLDELRQKTGKKAAADMKKLKAKFPELKALWTAAKPSRKAILAKQAQIRKIRQKLGVIKVDAHLALHKILTTEQKQTLIKEMEACHSGKGCPEGCGCPHCKPKAGTQPPAGKKPGCKGCPGDCPHGHHH